MRRILSNGTFRAGQAGWRSAVAVFAALFFLVAQTAALSHEVGHLGPDHNATCLTCQFAKNLSGLEPVGGGGLLGPAPQAAEPDPASTPTLARATRHTAIRAPPLSF